MRFTLNARFICVWLETCTPGVNLGQSTKEQAITKEGPTDSEPVDKENCSPPAYEHHWSD